MAGRYRLLDLMRAAAALWVVGFHYQFSAGFQAAVPGLHRVLKHGDFGVPMFFVISGYCLAAAAAATRRRGEGPGRFLRRRLLRVFPPFWASLAVAALLPVAAGWAGTPGAEAAGPLRTADGWEWLRVATLTQGFSLGAPRAFAVPYEKFNAAYWTLGYEVQFYLVVALAVGLGRAGGGVLLAATAASVPMLVRQDLWVDGLFLPMWPQFAAGVLAFECVRSCPPAAAVLGGRAARAAFVAGLAGLLAVAVADPLADFNYAFDRAAFAAGFAGLLWLGTSWEPALAAWEAGRGWLGPAGRAAFGLGAISYSVYLLHVPLLALLGVAGPGERPGWADSPAADAAVLAGLVAACVPFYYCFERPFVGGRQPVPAPSVP